MKNSTPTYQVFGQYYALNDLQFRRVLLITKNTAIKKSDALVVMMNPGGSKPKNGEYNDQLTDASPDRTQYKIMKLMDTYNWSKVTVINLSDYVEIKSYKFNRKLRDLFTSHSIFDSSRSKELEKVCRNLKSNAPVFVAWGIAQETLQLRSKAYSFLEKKIGKPIGYSYGNDAYCFVHPMACKLKKDPFRRGGFDWVKEIIKY